MFVNYSITFLNLYNDIIFNSEEIALKGLLMEDLKWSMPFDSRNDFYFKPSSRDFIVDEVPLYEFSGSGEHLIIRVRKKNLTTWEMIEIFSNYLGVKKREIGYAGLKDKNALTTQYISIPKKYEKGIKSLSNKNIKILFTTYHNNKIRVGHLKGNDFKLRFKKVLNINKEKLNSALEWIRKNGIPNYFGTQRFGIDGNNYKDGKKILCGKMKIRDKKSKEFLISAYQSYLFNKWLSKRVELSKLLNSFESQEVEKILQLETGSLKNIEKQKNFFKLLKGDLMMHYPFGKIFYIDILRMRVIDSLIKISLQPGQSMVKG